MSSQKQLKTTKNQIISCDTGTQAEHFQVPSNKTFNSQCLLALVQCDLRNLLHKMFK